MKYFLAVFILLVYNNALSFGQRKSKKNKITTINIADQLGPNLQNHIRILSSDSMEGRRTGSYGEQLAADYIKNQFTVNGIGAMGENSGYFQKFEVNEGREYEKESYFYINDFALQPNTDFFPLNISGDGEISEISSPILRDPNSAWYLDIKDELQKNEKNIHYDVNGFIQDKIKEFSAKGIAALIIYNSSEKLKDNIVFDKKANVVSAKLPVIYLAYPAFKKYIKTNDGAVEIKIKIILKEKKRTGTNVIAYINNEAEKTIIIGGHYDHLGFGEDHNSLHTGEKMIHNGADDNASGVAALIELSRILKNTAYKNNNFLFIAFSGEELGLFGSKYFTEHPTIDLQKVNYMINMDMIGRLNDSTKAFTVGGYGTSPTWGSVIKTSDQWNTLQVKTDSAGTGPSDHTSFYKKDIPVLFFFTGTHGDYHKPSDDFEKINFRGEEKIVQYILSVIKETDPMPKLLFSKTRETSNGSSRTRFTVSLGIMPDYTFSGPGVKVDGVSEGKLAQKTGVKAGDIVMKLGDQEILSVENYMKALGMFKKGENTKLVILREGKEISYDITF